MKIIKLSESDLEKIVKKVISEQKYSAPTDYYGQKYSTNSNPSDYLGKGGGFERHNFPQRFTRKPQPYEKCVPDALKAFIIYVMTSKGSLMKKVGVDEKTFLQMVKAAIGIIGRETKYGKYTETSDDVSEWMRANGLGSLINGVLNVNNAARKAVGKSLVTQSLGLAQFTPETWQQYELDKLVGPYDDSLGATKQGLGALFKLSAEYRKALKAGLNADVPSQNQILQKNGVIGKINGTGNNALDAAIVSHNMPSEKLATKYCTTNNPLYAAPCHLSTYTPFESENSFNKNKSVKLLDSAKVDQKFKGFPGNLTVNKGEVLPGYFPNLRGPNHTAIGYLEEVVNNMNSLNCF